jgi:hypothetical protein
VVRARVEVEERGCYLGLTQQALHICSAELYDDSTYTASIPSTTTLYYTIPSTTTIDEYYAPKSAGGRSKDRGRYSTPCFHVQLKAGSVCG